VSPRRHRAGGDPLPAPGVVRVQCRQLAPRVGDAEGNTRLILDAVAAAVADRVDVVVLPELATSGYVFETLREAQELAITRDDDLFGRIGELLPASTVVVLGFPENEDDTLYNSVAVIGAAGCLAVYRKTHLWDREKLFFTPGDEHPPLVETAHGRLGILVCYDLEMPEMPRSLALRGADLLVVPVNWPVVAHPAGEKAPELILAQAAARVNGVFIACCDRAGTERGQEWTEGTAVIDQYGWVVAWPEGHVATADIFPALAREKAISARNDLLGDRRPELYTDLGMKA
jgi:predicted amidohydrolase